ncbi:hypothetical protein Tco_0496665 [Tanacetum coccineum]
MSANHGVTDDQSLGSQTPFVSNYIKVRILEGLEMFLIGRCPKTAPKAKSLALHISSNGSFQVWAIRIGAWRHEGMRRFDVGKENNLHGWGVGIRAQIIQDSFKKKNVLSRSHSASSIPDLYDQVSESSAKKPRFYKNISTTLEWDCRWVEK